MLYLKKITPLEITKNTGELLVIERPRNLQNLSIKLIIYLIVGLASLYYAFKYYKEIQAMTSFLLMACAVPIIYTVISVSRLITEIKGWKLTFDKHKGLFSIFSKPIIKLEEIKEVVLKQTEKSEGKKNGFDMSFLFGL
jgi:hypothetical protein